MNDNVVTRRFQAVMTCGTSLFMSIVYLLFSPNWIGPLSVWILEANVLW